MKKLLLLLTLSICLPNAYAQKKQSTEDIKITQAINLLLSKQDFTFHANRILSSNLTTQRSTLTFLNTLKVTKDSIIVNLPYLGDGFTASDLGSQRNPLQFISTEFTYDLQNNKRGDRIITIDAKSPHDLNRFTFTIVVSKGISAKLIVNQISRSSMQFSGYIQGNGPK